MKTYKFFNEHFSEIMTAAVAILGMLATFFMGFMNSHIEQRKQQRQYLLQIYFPLIEKLKHLQLLLEQLKSLKDESDVATRRSLDAEFETLCGEILEFINGQYQVCSYFLHKKITELYIFLLNSQYDKQRNLPTQQKDELFAKTKPPNIPKLIKSLTKNITR